MRESSTSTRAAARSASRHCREAPPTRRSWSRRVRRSPRCAPTWNARDLADLATVEPIDVERFLAAGGGGPWDLAFLDPPYEVRAIVAPLRALEPHLAPDAMVVVKHFWRTEIPEVGGLASVRQRRFGETMLSFLEAAGR